MPPLLSLVALSLALLSSAPPPPGPPLGPLREATAPRWLWPALQRGAAARPLEGAAELEDSLDEEEAWEAAEEPGLRAGVPGGGEELPDDEADELDERLEEWP